MFRHMIFCQLSNRSINDVELIQVIIVIERSRCYATSSNMKTLIFFLFFFFFSYQKLLLYCLRSKKMK